MLITSRQWTPSAKLTADPASIQLYVKDRYSTGEVQLKAADATLSEISRVELDAASAKMFTIRELGFGKYVIGYKDNKLPVDAKGSISVKVGQSKTVKLNVFLKGNETTKANATVSVKISLK